MKKTLLFITFKVHVILRHDKPFSKTKQRSYNSIKKLHEQNAVGRGGGEQSGSRLENFQSN